MPRVVFDTSTLVGAVLRANSVPHRAFLLAQRTGEILACQEAFAEIETVLHRERLSHLIPTGVRDDFLEMYRATVEWIEVGSASLTALQPPCRDPRDNIFLALALAGDADLIVTSDQDLLVLHPWRGIPILTPAEFIAESEP